MKLDLDKLIGSSNAYHVYSGFFWSLLSVALGFLWQYFLLIGPAWAGLVLYRELVVERKVQVPKKTKMDLLTKLVGLSSYLITLVHHFI